MIKATTENIAVKAIFRFYNLKFAMKNCTLNERLVNWGTAVTMALSMGYFCLPISIKLALPQEDPFLLSVHICAHGAVSYQGASLFTLTVLGEDPTAGGWYAG